jgi:hypothetical protein
MSFWEARLPPDRGTSNSGTAKIGARLARSGTVAFLNTVEISGGNPSDVASQQ